MTEIQSHIALALLCYIGHGVTVLWRKAQPNDPAWSFTLAMVLFLAGMAYNMLAATQLVAGAWPR